MFQRLLPPLLGALLIAGCASTQAPDKFRKSSEAGGTEVASAFVRPGRAPFDDVLPRKGRLAGRTISVSNVYDIRLKPREVVLTFDDGPVPDRAPPGADAL